MREDLFNRICKECADKDLSCCNYKLFLVKEELDKVKGFKKDVKYKKDRSGYKLVRDTRDKRHRCQFLGSNGCVLPDDSFKPFDCLLFPLNIIYRNGEIEFYLSKCCIFYKEISKEWIDKTKKWATERFNSWSEQEKKDYSKSAEEIEDEDMLIRV